MKIPEPYEVCFISYQSLRLDQLSIVTAGSWLEIHALSHSNNIGDNTIVIKYNMLLISFDQFKVTNLITIGIIAN